jgi:hypothetical protein
MEAVRPFDSSQFSIRLHGVTSPQKTAILVVSTVSTLQLAQYNGGYELDGIRFLAGV